MFVRVAQTRLAPPISPYRRVTRPRLIDRIVRGGLGRVVIVTGPAGGGKTTVLSEAFAGLGSVGIACCWMSLDRLSADFQSFFASLGASIRTVRPQSMQSLEVLLGAEAPRPEQLTSSIINDLLEDSAPIAIFLDDYHLVTDERIIDAMCFFFEYMPANVLIVIGSRDAPLLQLSRLRARGSLEMIGWADLQFTISDVKEYASTHHQLILSEDTARALVRATEGWIIGIQLAISAFRDDRKFSFENLTGSRAEVADYLFAEIFSRQPLAIQMFLVETSFLEQLSVPLCNATTGRHDAKSMLEELERRNLLTFRLGPDSGWYRYHTLFATFLRERLRNERPDDVPVLALRAIEWLSNNRMKPEAFHLSVWAEVLDKAAALCLSCGRDLFADGAFHEVDKLVSTLPERVVSRSPGLCVLHAWALCYLGETDKSYQRTMRASHLLASAPPMEVMQFGSGLKAEIAVLSSIIGVVQRDEPNLALAKKNIISEIGDADNLVLGFAHVTLGRIARVEGKLDTALEHYRKAGMMADPANSPLLVHLSALNRSVILRLQCRLSESEALLGAHLGLSASRRWLRSAPTAFVRVQHAINLFDMCRWTEAQTELADALSVLESTETYWFYGLALIERARNAVALRQDDSAWADIRRAWEMARDQNAPRVKAQADLLAARLAANSGDFESASSFISQADHSGRNLDKRSSSARTEIQELALIETMRLLLHQRDPVAAFRQSRFGLVSSEAAGRHRHSLEFLALQAVALRLLGQEDRAERKLIEILSMWGDEQFLSPYMFPGVTLDRTFLSIADKGSKAGSQARRLGKALDTATCLAARTNTPQSAAVPVKLHFREEQMIRLLAVGMRNNEIAVRLGIADETVKWYLKSLFAKLQASNRTEAVSIARKLQLF